MFEKPQYILVLPSWYPSKVDAFNGDFNERTVNALSKQVKQVVLYVVKRNSIKKIETELNEIDNVITYRVYYPAIKLLWGSRLVSVFFYYYLSRRYIKRIIAQYGKPELIHMYVILNAGIMAPWLKKKYKVPIVMTEHWTAFYDYASNSLNQYSLFAKYLIKRLYRSIDHIMPVAEALSRQVKKWAPQVHQTVIPNVVDTKIFTPSFTMEKRPVLRFLHVSSFKYQKNPDGLLRAFEQVLKAGHKAELWLIGPADERIEKIIANSSLLSRFVSIKGEVSYEKVAFFMQQTDCLLMFSRFENLPCVILEAQCCGLPVIATNVGGIKEVVNSTNGLLINSEDKNDLKNAVLKMLTDSDKYKRDNISKSAAKLYSYESIAEDILQVYNHSKV